MKPYKRVEVSESILEDLVRQHPHYIEEGLTYVDHQRATGSGRLDVLLVDSGKSLVLAELKIGQDDGMLLQGVDYYDYVSNHVEAFARLYKQHGIDPTQQVRLFLIAPAFSQTLVNRCKWLDLPIFLFSFQCLNFEGEHDVIPIFWELPIPTQTEKVEVKTIADHLNYITDETTRNQASALLEEIKGWNSGSILLDPIKYAISLKVNGRVFANFSPRRRHYNFATYSLDEEWTEFAVRDADDLTNVTQLVRSAMERQLLRG